MSIKVRISPILRRLDNIPDPLEIRGRSAAECLHDLEVQFPNVRRWLRVEGGALRPQVLFFVNGKRVYSDELASPLEDGDELTITAAIGGG